MEETSSPTPTRVSPPLSFHVVLWVAVPLLGALVGWLLAFALDWIVSLSWAPFQGPLTLVDELTGAWTMLALIAVGVVTGVAVAVISYREVTIVTVDTGTVTITRNDKAIHVAGTDVAAVFVEKDHLVIQDRSGRILARAPISDLPADKLEAAFATHTYSWMSADPFETAFARWVPDAPFLPSGANAIFVARQKALEKGDKGDQEDFRLELQKVGIIVRDDNQRQYWRPVE